MKVKLGLWALTAGALVIPGLDHLTALAFGLAAGSSVQAGYSKLKDHLGE